MARVKGPVYSADATGNFAGGLIQFRHHRGGLHVYRPTDPSRQNQKSPSSAQQAIRQRYREALAAWRGLSESARSDWNARGATMALSGWNLFLSKFQGAVPQNLRPTAVIDAIAPAPAEQGQLVTFTGHATDVDGSIAAYEWSSSRDGVLSTSASFTSSTLSVGAHVISFRARDDAGLWSVPAIFPLEIRPVQPPSEYVPPAGDAVEFIWLAGDPAYVPPAGDAVIFAWPA